MSTLQRIAVLTGGGDCPGLNAVIRAVTRDALNRGVEVLGVEDGYLGLIENRMRPLSDADLAGILRRGGTILGSNNKANPSRFATGKNADGTHKFEDLSESCLRHLRSRQIDALVIIGGDGTMTSAAMFASRGVNVVGVPKTIDNDIEGTELTFGFQTAVDTATDALDRVRTTADSHHRIMVVEVMGRNAGWIALHAGVASASDAILIPEIPFDLEILCDAAKDRIRRGKRSTLICVSEGSRPKGGSQLVAKVDATSPDPIRLGGVAKFIAEAMEERTGIESRYVVLGHVQRGGVPCAFDRVLATQLGHHAMSLVLAGKHGRMVAVQRGTLVDIPIDEPAGRQRLVPVNHPLLDAARAVGASFGDSTT
jgi:phosphofructokinase-like protein